MDIYKVTYQGLVEYQTPSAFATQTGKTYNLNERVTTIKRQINVAGVMEFLQLQNGNWIPAIWNGKIRVTFVETIDDNPPPPPPVVEPVHVLLVNNFGQISDNGLPYE